MSEKPQDELRSKFCTIASKHLQDDDALDKAVWNTKDFQALPKHHQFFVIGFVAGRRAEAREKPVVQPQAQAQAQPQPQPQAVLGEQPPPAVKALQPGARWKRHPNGGGWVSSTAQVDVTCNIGAQSVVYENAVVRDRAKIYGAAKVHGSAQISGSCHVHGLAQVRGNAQVRDAAKVLGKVVLEGKCIVGGNALVREGTFDKGEFYERKKVLVPETAVVLSSEQIRVLAR